MNLQHSHSNIFVCFNVYIYLGICTRIFFFFLLLLFSVCVYPCMCLCRCLVCFFWVCDNVFLSLCEWLMVSGDCYVSWQRCTLFSLLHKITLIMETLLIRAIRISHYAIMCSDFMHFMRIAWVNAGQSLPWLSFLISLINQHNFH